MNADVERTVLSDREGGNAGNNRSGGEGGNERESEYWCIGFVLRSQ